MALPTGEEGGGGSSRPRGHGTREATGTAAVLSAAGHAAGADARASTLEKSTSGEIGSNEDSCRRGSGEIGNNKDSCGRGSNSSPSGGGGVTPASTSGGSNAPTEESAGFSTCSKGGGGIISGGAPASGRGGDGGDRCDEGERGRPISIHFKGSRAHLDTLFVGFLVILLGFKSPSKEKIEAKIRARGGLVVSLSAYEKSTHICLAKEEGKNDADVEGALQIAGKKIITDEWILKCCAENRIYDESESGTLLSSSQGTVKTGNLSSKRSNEEIDEEKVRRCLHQLFFCEKDLSLGVISLAEYGLTMKGKSRISEECPGSESNPTFHTSSEMEIKLLVKDIYMLLQKLNSAGYTLGGKFSAKNFILVEGLHHRRVLFGKLEQGSLQWMSDGAEEKDIKSFKMMIRREVFKGVLQPHDMTVWLSMVGCPEYKPILLSHLFLLDDQECCNKFLGLCDTFKDEIEAHQKTHRKDAFNRIITNMSAYNHWQKVVADADGNSYLKQTMCHAATKNISYPNNVSGLLRVLRIPGIMRHEGSIDAFFESLPIISQT